MAKHIHYENMMIAANDSSIEWQYLEICKVYQDIASIPITIEEWVDLDGTPPWCDTVIYRVKPYVHPHQAMIDQAKADPTIQWQCRYSPDGSWLNVRFPLWWLDTEFRQKPYVHPHQAMIDEAEADPTIVWQYKDSLGEWDDCYGTPEFFAEDEYRQKPAHPHQTLIDQAKADPSIKWQFRSSAPGWPARWRNVNKVFWDPDTEYRVQPKAIQEVNVHQHFIDMKKADPSIKFQLHVPSSDVTNLGNVWHNTSMHPSNWMQSDTYRVKPTDVMITVYHWAVKLVYEDIPELSSTAYMFETLEAAQKYATAEIHPRAKVLGRIEGSEFTYWTEK